MTASNSSLVQKARASMCSLAPDCCDSVHLTPYFAFVGLGTGDNYCSSYSLLRPAAAAAAAAADAVARQQLFPSLALLASTPYSPSQHRRYTN